MPQQSSDHSVNRDQSEGAASRYEIQRSLGRIEGQLQAINTAFIQHMQDDASNFKELKLSQGITQKKLYTFSGMLIAIAFVLTHTDKILSFIK